MLVTWPGARLTTNDAPDPPAPAGMDASTYSEYPLPPFVTLTESTNPSQLHGAAQVPELAHVSQILAEGLHPETHVVPVHEHWLPVGKGTVAVHFPSVVHAHLHFTSWPLGNVALALELPHVELLGPVHLT